MNSLMRYFSAMFYSISYSFFFFFFQAEDGIRDIGVTGVQTCALPIFAVQRPLVRSLIRHLQASSSVTTASPRLCVGKAFRQRHPGYARSDREPDLL